MLVLAHPLDAHGAPGESGRDERRVGTGVVRGVVSVAAGSFDVDAAHAIGRKVQELGDRTAQRVHAL